MKQHDLKPLFIISIILMTFFLNGCATTGKEYVDERDPYENINRAIFKFNDGIDKILLKPIATGYKKVIPAPIDKGISNFFDNLKEISNIVNNTLQFKFKQASSDTGRLLINSTIGLLGFLDVASDMNLPKHHEDFGQTLGAWGVGSGPYLVLPILGSSTLRDSAGSVVGWYTDPVSHVTNIPLRIGLQTTRVIDTRADLLGASNILEKTGIDSYDLLKASFLQQRKHLIYDGFPPEDADDIEFNFDDE